MVTLADLIGVAGAGIGETLAIVSTRDGDYVLAVDGVLDTEELVVKPAAPAVMATGFYAGQTLPDSGRPMLLLDAAGLAAVAGIHFDRTPTREEAQATVTDAGLPAMLFEDLDGRRRLIALAAVDRVETVAVEAVQSTGGRWRLSLGERSIPVHLTAPLPADGEVAVLRLTDGQAEIAYAIAEAVEIVQVGTDVAPAGEGLVAGVVVLNGEQLELVDALTLFAGDGGQAATRPLCLLSCDGSGWMEAFLKPALEGAGYRCATRLPAGEQAAVTLVMADAPAPAVTGGTVVQLRREVGGGPDSIYRYDRAALIAAVARRVAGA